MNNDVKNLEGETIGFRCNICDQVKTKMWGTVCNECARKNERETVEWQKGYDFAKKEEKKKDYTMAYEIIALMFFNDTNLMAPGKSVAPQMMDSRYQDGSRETAWQKWQELNKAHIKAVMELV